MANWRTVNLSSPGAIGGTTPAAGTFTAVTADSYLSNAVLYANLPAAASNTGKVYRVSNFGITGVGTKWISDGTRWVPDGPQIIARGGAGVAVTGTTSETAAATISIPANALGLNSGLLIYHTWTVTNNANAKTLRVRLNGITGTVFAGFGVASQATVHDIRRIRNRNSASSQVGSYGALNAGGIGGATGEALPTGAIDTTAAVDLVLSATLADGTDTATLANYEVWLVP